ncbi:MAG: endonuclease III [Sandaracinaceae bacterium]|nr:endonuclease III [Sandaracinaceae bacterium]MDW8245123.1 endonuclease III [Sandaracinaceae bacterium]
MVSTVVSKKEKAARIAEMLNSLFPNPPIPLHHRDPFTLLVAVVLSAQTTDKKVNEVTPALFERAPTPEAMARLDPREVEGLIRGVGLAPQKAKALVALSKILVERHGGKVPASFDELIALPGVGRKSASVVLAQAFGQAAFPVDTHIHRLAKRWGLSDGTSVRRTEEDLKRLFDPSLWPRLHLQMIYFGRTYCPARGHDWDRCPICSWAGSKRVRAQEEKQRTPRRTTRSAERGATAS